MNRSPETKLRCFISHSSDDEDVKKLVEILNKHFSAEKNQYDFFCTSTSDSALAPGEEVARLRIDLQQSTCMIAVMTDSYLRSPICLTELSAMWYASSNTKNIIPLVYSPTALQFLEKDWKVANNIVYLPAFKPSSAQDNAALMVKGLRNNGFVLSSSDKENELLEALTDFFKNTSQEVPKRPYIGSGEIYANINTFCEDYGIKQITNGVVDHSVTSKNLEGKKELYFVMTTGSSFIEPYAKEFFQKQVAQGTSIYMILPNRMSAFCKDVAFIENPNEANLDRLNTEFDNVVKKLKTVADEAEKLAQKQNTTAGRVYLCCAHTLLRQTVGLAIDDKDRCWGWITATMPPARASGTTPTIVFEGDIAQEDSFCRAVYNHATSMVEVARKRNNLIDLGSEPDFEHFDESEIIDLDERKKIEKDWEEKLAKAHSYVEKRQDLKDRALIEIAAQHPLNDGKPGKEFQARLDYGFRLYQDLVQAGKTVRIYVPGSVHMKDGVADSISLSEAGCTYLKELGVPEECLFGEDENNEYMGEKGVYNSCDECFVSSSIFKDRGFGILHCICSTNQAPKKQLFYLNFQVAPVIHTVNTETPYHRLTKELLYTIPNVLYKNSNWSESDCPEFRSSREERMPGYKTQKKQV